MAGYAAYIVSKPTLPLKVSFTRIATASDDQSGYDLPPLQMTSLNLCRRSLARANHTVTVVGNRAYIFGGNTATNALATNDVHAITLGHSGEPEMDYSMIPALPTFEGERTPAARTNHAACSFHGNIVVYGGCDQKEDLIDEKSSMWLFNPERKAWDLLSPSSVHAGPGPRQNAQLFSHKEFVILYGGVDGSGSHASDLWRFDVASRSWTQLPTAPVATSNATLANGQLWLISGSDSISSQIHHLGISSSNDKDVWDSFTFPTNPMAPGPRARHDGALRPISTGWGRNYLVYLFGVREGPDLNETIPDSQNPEEAKVTTQWSDTWVLQIPSSDLEPKASFTLKEAIKPAKIKDAIRSAIGADTGHLSWSEAVVQVPSDKAMGEIDGKLHPGPRAFFGADVMNKGDSLIIWGGVDAKGDRIGDGWIVRFE